MRHRLTETLPRRAVLLLGGGALLAAALPAGALRAQRLTGNAVTPVSPAAGIPIGIIGSGNIGGTFGTLWAKAGHPVLFSSRHPESLKSLVETAGPLARAGTPAEAAAFGQAILVAVPYAALPGIGRELGPALSGKVVLDACNAVPARDGDIAATAKEKGIGLLSAELLPGARVVRAFNTMGYRVFQAQAHRAGDKLAVPIAGDDPAALQIASVLVRDAGFEPVVTGGLATASQFAQGAPGYGQQVTARELRGRLGLPEQ